MRHNLFENAMKTVVALTVMIFFFVGCTNGQTQTCSEDDVDTIPSVSVESMLNDVIVDFNGILQPEVRLQFNDSEEVNESSIKAKLTDYLGSIDFDGYEFVKLEKDTTEGVYVMFYKEK